FLYKACFSGEPFVHIFGSRYTDRTERITTVKVYSNQRRVALYLNGKKIEEKSGDKVFMFQVPLHGEAKIEARAGDCTDACTLRYVDTPNPAYTLPKKSGKSANWV
ncbi:MAG: glycoside hydrolase family 2 protein, partial [Oscillibacter sp.]|nr:glycoside hydrolase family 2 protein [Oscillibacter sp.]